MKFKKSLIYLLFMLIILTITACSTSLDQGKYDTFAKALTEKDVKMYGTEWCSHCKNQKELFGTSFQYINYIDCDKESYVCDAAGVKGFPTWKINGELYPGEQSMVELSELSGVELTFDLEDSENTKK